MKLVSSKETFSFKHDGFTTIRISPSPQKVSDEVARHLESTFGGLVTIAPLEAADQAQADAEAVKAAKAKAKADQEAEAKALEEKNADAMANTGSGSISDDQLI